MFVWRHTTSNDLHTKGREGEIKGIPIVKSETSTRQNPLFNKYAPDDRKKSKIVILFIIMHIFTVCLPFF